MTPPLFGVAGWKNGKTTLMIGLIAELARRNYAASIIGKHAHANFESRSTRLRLLQRAAGACQVALSSPRRFAVMRELGGAR